MNARQPMEREPADVFGPGYLVHCLTQDFIDLVRVVGFEAARAEMAEIINNAAKGRRHNG